VELSPKKNNDSVESLGKKIKNKWKIFENLFLLRWCISMVGELLLESVISNEASFRTRGGA
jgi:hypothetical protein